jgi:hypothetical protein
MKKLWNWLDGKKSKIALIYWTVLVPALPILFDDNVPDNISKGVIIFGYLLTTLGLGHAGIKSLTK